MNIWNILGIEPTTDKKVIKKAYAAKTKEIHPEERPEEFKQLHEAYQAALGYADYIRQIEQSGGSVTWFYDAAKNGSDDDGGDETADAEEEAGQEELRAYFEKNQEEHGQQVEAFLNHWKEFHGPYRDQEAMAWWKAYLSSEGFQDIRYHPQVLGTLAEEIDDKCIYGIDEVKMLFWNAYGFQEDEEGTYHGDQQRLYRSLYPAYEKHISQMQYEQKCAKNDKLIRVFIGVGVAALVFICLMIYTTSHRQRENGRLFLIDYMAKQYPETVFSEPERIDKEDDGSIVYELFSSAHPELSVTAKVKFRYIEGKKAYVVTENYSQMLFEHYAAQYGLEGSMITYSYAEGPYETPEVSEYSALFYPGIEELDTFCETATRMFREQEELQNISEVAVYTEDVLFPEMLAVGGMPELPFADMQLYDLRAVEAETLLETLREAYMCYMFQFESWNITPEQYREWGTAYEKRSGEWEGDDGEWHEVCDPDTGELLCRFFIPTYRWQNGYHSIQEISIPSYTRMITVGNAYYFLQDRGANLTVSEDGSGFYVTFYGNENFFGRDPSVDFNDLRDWY